MRDMTTPKSPSEKLREIRDEHAKKIAEFDADQARRIEEIRLENEARIAAEEAVAKAAAEEFDKAEKAAENAFKEAEAKKKAAQRLSDQHLKLFGSKPSSKDKDSDDTDEGIAPSLKNWKIWGWMVFLLPKVITVLLLAVIAWLLVWGYFGIANFMGNADTSVGYDAGAVSDPEPTAVSESTVVPTGIPEPTAVSESVVEQTAVPEPTAEPTAIANSNPKPTKPMEQKPKPTAVTVVAPAIPIVWNSGPSGVYKPVAGMICHGDQVGPFGSSDGTRPVIVQFWSNQPETLSMAWASCEVNTGRNLNQIKAEVEAKYSKTFEVVNN
jgi:hypothetical protein